MLSYPLTKTQIEHFRRDGFVLVPSVVGRENLAMVDQTIQNITEQAVSTGAIEGVLELEPEPVNGQRVARRILNPFEQHEVFRITATDQYKSLYTLQAEAKAAAAQG